MNSWAVARNIPCPPNVLETLFDKNSAVCETVVIQNQSCLDKIIIS
jgi:hypothetical protein